MKRILVTGGAGFIGSNLCHRLVHEGHMVYCIDNFYTGQIANVDDLMQSPRFRIISHDVREKLPHLAVDEIYNLACPASPIHYQKNPLYTSETSYLGAMNALNLANENGCKVLQASTSEVYGDALTHPQRETYWGNVNPNGIRSCYDEGKRIAESMFMDYNRQYGTRIKIVRIFNTYGPYMAANDGRVVSNFIMQSLRGNDITIYGDGKQTRSLQYIDDLLNGIQLVMSSDDNVITPFNIGNPHECTINEIAHKISRLVNSSSKFVYKPLPADDPRRRKPCIEKMEKTFGWNPAIGLEEGLKKTIEYFKSVNNGES